MSEHFGGLSGPIGGAAGIAQTAYHAEKRDMFAAAALTGMLHNGFIPKQFLGPKPEDGPPPLRDYATAAFAIADAMLEARSK
jgi:hypothetical protein